MDTSRICFRRATTGTPIQYTADHYSHLALSEYSLSSYSSPTLQEGKNQACFLKFPLWCNRIGGISVAPGHTWHGGLKDPAWLQVRFSLQLWLRSDPWPRAGQRRRKKRKKKQNKTKTKNQREFYRESNIVTMRIPSLAQWVKDLVLLWRRPAAAVPTDSYPGNFHMLQVQPFKSRGGTS